MVVETEWPKSFRCDDPQWPVDNLCHVDIEPERVHAIENSRVGLCSIITNEGDATVSQCNLTVNLVRATALGLRHRSTVSEHPSQLLRTLTATAPARFNKEAEHWAAVGSDWPIDKAELA
jgi:hypothetical protein